MRTFVLALALLFTACGSEAVDTGDAGVLDAAVGDAGSCLRAACSDFDLTATRYDAATHVLTVVLDAEAPEIVSGSVSFSAARMGMVPSTYSAVLGVNGRTLSADLSRWLVADTVFFGQLSLTLVSSCGGTSVVGDLGVTTGTSADGITVTAFQCL